MEIVEGSDAEAAKNPQWGYSVGSLYVAACCYLVWMFAQLGDFMRVEVYGDRAIAEAQRIENWQGEACARYFRMLALAIKGDLKIAEEEARALVAFCEPKRLIMWIALAHVTRGWVLAHMGNPDEGIRLLESGILIWERVGLQASMPLFLALLGEAFLLRGSLERALETVD